MKEDEKEEYEQADERKMNRRWRHIKKSRRRKRTREKEKRSWWR